MGWRDFDGVYTLLYMFAGGYMDAIDYIYFSARSLELVSTWQEPLFEVAHTATVLIGHVHYVFVSQYSI